MRFQAFLILIAAIFVVTGCGGRARYDGRLVQADSLMWADADSALAVLSALDTLRGAADSAYRDLLLTQARYKTYQDITARDDSAITRALHWYRAHNGEREKLTRANLYKGAVMEELGHVDSAMIYYKTAEAAADTTDYANLGQINTRIADLFRLNDCSEQICFDKYKTAFKYHQLTGNKMMQLMNLCRMYMMNAIVKRYDKDKLFEQALSLANELGNDEMKFYILELKCRSLMKVDSSLPEAKQIAQYCMKEGSEYIGNDLLLDFAYIYAKGYDTDSARRFISLVDVAANEFVDQARVSARKNDILCMIAQLEGLESVSARHIAQSGRLSDSIMNNADRFGIEKIESGFNDSRRQEDLSKINDLNWTLILLSLGAAAVIVAMAVTFVIRFIRVRKQIKALRCANSHEHDRILSQLDDQSSITGRLLANMIILIKSLADNQSHVSATRVADQIKETIVDVANDDFWTELRSYLDKNYSGLMTDLEREYHLNEKEMKFIELVCCGFSAAEMAIILDYSPKYVFTKRKRIALKMGLSTTLQDYLNNLKSGRSSESSYRQ